MPRTTGPLCATAGMLRALAAVWLGLTALLTAPAARAQVQLPPPEASEPIQVTGDKAQQWMQDGWEVWLLHGNVHVRQGRTAGRADDAAVWIKRADFVERQVSRVVVYFEGNVAVDTIGPAGRSHIDDNIWLGRLTTAAAVEVRAVSVEGKPAALPAIYDRSLAQRDPPVQQVPALGSQYTAPVPEGGVPPGVRRLRAYPRSNLPVQVVWSQDPTSGLWVAVIDSGVTLIVDGLPDFGSIDVTADRMVIWTAGLQDSNLGKDGAHQPHDAPLEIYMEGNIVFRQGTRTVYADRMYYDVRSHRAVILDVDLLTPVAKYEGLLRLRAAVVQQIDESHFYARNGYFTSSRLGIPGYRAQLGDIYFEDLQTPGVDPVTGLPVLDPKTGQPAVEHHHEVSGRSSVVYVDDVPVFYWPVFATDADNPEYYIRKLAFKEDNVFGTQFLTSFDAYQLLGIHRKPAGTELDLNLDYLSQRGFGHGGTFTYNRQDPLFDNFGGPYSGLLDFYGIYDHGEDNLGGYRDPLPLQEPYRYRGMWRHREVLPDDFRLTVETTVLSDRNFMEEYYQREWGESYDLSTSLELKKTQEDMSYSLTADYRVNNFLTETNWLPRLDHFWLGKALLDDKLTWYEHSSVGYAQFNPAQPPSQVAYDPIFSILPWERNSASGERLVSRQEIDYPFQFGPIKIIPYALGELGHWGQDLNHDEYDRAYGLLGVRASMPVWSVDPTVESELWNLHGIAHKVVFNMNAFAASSSQQLNQNGQPALPLYDPIDDPNIDQFRRHFAWVTFNSGDPFGAGATNPPNYVPPVPVPAQFDPRLYALRYGMGDWVTGPSEIADQISEVQLGVEQRWQTKRGPEDQRHVEDWIDFDTHLTIYPMADRDDFGKPVGLLDYDFHWFVGDRLTVVSDGLWDFFEDGQSIVRIGAFLSRPPRGSLYVGMSVLNGPIRSDVLSMNYSYWMSPKWISSAGVSLDFGQNWVLSENLTLTRVGESFLISASFGVDSVRGTVSASAMIEPRFLPKNKLGVVGGARLPPAGSEGLE